MLRIKLIKSKIGHNVRNRATIQALGLRKPGQIVEHEDTPTIRGMIHHVHPMLQVEEVAGTPAKRNVKGVGKKRSTARTEALAPAQPKPKKAPRASAVAPKTPKPKPEKVKAEPKPKSEAKPKAAAKPALAEKAKETKPKAEAKKTAAPKKEKTK